MGDALGTDRRNLVATVDATHREITSDKGHDAFLVQWDQMTAILREALNRDEVPEIAASA